ncbi:MAG: hypothetical protein AAFQ43_01330 [Bacteroidota bacterium]
MGQQQLLLLVLGIVIVGLAVVVGIRAFEENSDKANQDAIVSDGIRIVNNAQAWGLKPAPYGGGAGSFTNLTFGQINYDTGTNSYYENSSGRFGLVVTAGTPGSFVLTACNDESGNKTTFTVTGFDESDIATDTEASTATCPS